MSSARLVHTNGLGGRCARSQPVKNSVEAFVGKLAAPFAGALATESNLDTDILVGVARRLRAPGTNGLSPSGGKGLPRGMSIFRTSRLTRLS